ncbi:hypothetical protein KSP40_PGU000694 [Platanthera guangdongensis]|uniref:Uncharacterized protein n=1 Tax=Platanthera guangdongensis TaxID=2320717 RepID=A0ABR2M7L5_9ASPA
MHSEDAGNDKLKLSMPVSSAIHRRPWPTRKISGAEDMMKHMPTIPRYLQFEDNEYNSQEMALNVGVLDCGRLQKWTGNEKPAANNMFHDSPSNSIPSFLFSSFNSSSHSSRANGSPSPERKRSSSLDGQQPSKSSSTLDFESSADNDQRKGCRKDSSKLIIKSQAADIGSLPSASTGTENFALLRRNANTKATNLDELEKLEISSEKGSCRSHPYKDRDRPKQSRTKHLEEIIARSISSFDSSLLDQPREMNSICFAGMSSLPHSLEPSSSTHREEPHEAKENAYFERGGEQHPPIFLPRVDLKGISVSPSKSISDNSKETVLRSSSRGRRSPMRLFFDQPRKSVSSVNSISDNCDVVSGSSSSGRRKPVKQMMDPPLNSSNPDVSISRSSSSRGRHGPLRQMFELPRKSSSSVNSSQQQPHESCAAVDPPPCTENSSLDPKNLPSTREALLKLSWKNGLPLLMFSSSDDSILVAMMHKRSNPDMNICDCVYEIHTAMAVEVKKKNGAWLSHGVKSKRPEFACKFVAELIVSSFEQVSFDLSHHSFIRELVLVGDELVPSNREDITNLSNSELAAIVVETSQKKSLSYVLCVPKITVILPSDVHGLSNTKEPSKLIERWKSGGSCDCGGWDEGCALTILTNSSLEMNNSKSVEDCGAVDGTSRGFNLFTQSDARKGKHSFSMVAFKEDMFTVEFMASIHLLQALAISIALLHDRNPGDGRMRNRSADIDSFEDFSFDSSYPSNISLK